MNAQVIRIQGSAWRPRKGGSVKLVIEVHPGTQAEWVDALEMFKQKPELSVTVVAPYVAPAVTVITDKHYDRDVSSWPGTTSTLPQPVVVDRRDDSDGAAMKETVAVIKQGYDAIGPKADVDCPEPECALGLGHEGPHDFETPTVSAVAIVVRKDCPKPDCNLLAGHKGKCIKKKAAK